MGFEQDVVPGNGHRGLGSKEALPFAVSPQWLEGVPELQSMKDALSGSDYGDDDVTGFAVTEALADAGIEGEVAMASRQNMRDYAAAKLDDCTHGLTLSLCHLTRDIEDDNERKTTVRKMLRAAPQLRTVNTLLETPFAELLAETVGEMTDVYRTVRDAAETTAANTQNALLLYPEAGYEISKLLAGRKRAELDDTDGLLRVLGFALHVGYKDTETNQSILETLLDNLQTGSYDALIARDMLSFALSVENKNSVGIKEMYNLCQAMDPNASPEELEERLATIPYQWTRDARLEFATARATLIENIATQLAEHEAFAKTSGYSLPEVDIEELVEKRLDDLSKMVHAQSTTVRRGGAPQFKDHRNKHDVMRERVHRRKRRKERGQAASEEPEEAPTEETLVHRDLHFVDSQSELQSEKDSTLLADRVAEYVDQYKGTPRLAENVEGMLEFLRTVDFSQGRIRGIKGYESTINVNGHPAKVLGFKPMENPEVPTSTQPARKTRILFTLSNNGELGILAIVRREQVPVTEKRLGLVAGAR